MFGIHTKCLVCSLPKIKKMSCAIWRSISTSVNIQSSILSDVINKLVISIF